MYHLRGMFKGTVVLSGQLTLSSEKGWKELSETCRDMGIC